MKIYALHGWAYSTEKWQPLKEALKAKGYTLELLLIPGLTAELTTAWDIDDYIKWLNDELPSEPVILLGHSNGGRLALNFAWVYPERIKQLILIDSAGIYHGGLHQLKRTAFRNAAKIGKKITSSEKAQKVLYKLARVRDYKEAPEHMKIVMQNMINSDQSLNLAEITVPTAIIWGANDKVTPLTDGVKMQQQLSNSTFRVIEGARHSPQFTHIDEVVERIEEALREYI